MICVFSPSSAFDCELSEMAGSPDVWKAAYAGDPLWERNGLIWLNNIILSYNTNDKGKEPRILVTAPEAKVFKT